jgi:hypothetical protein
MPRHRAVILTLRSTWSICPIDQTADCSLFARASSVGGWMRAGRSFCLFVVLMLQASAALAESDQAVRYQGQDPQAKPVHRAQQVYSLRAHQKQGRCERERGSGLLNPCPDFASLGVSSVGVRRTDMRRSGGSRAVMHSGGHLMLFCVRMSDGYFFPTPNSQFAGYGDYDSTLDRCRFICQDPAMDVFVLDDAGQETDALRPMRGGQLYRELPVAFAYREKPDFRACNFQRYFQRSIDLQAQNNPDAIDELPVPRRRPDPARPELSLQPSLQAKMRCTARFALSAGRSCRKSSDLETSLGTKRLARASACLDHGPGLMLPRSHGPGQVRSDCANTPYRVLPALPGLRVVVRLAEQVFSIRRSSASTCGSTSRRPSPSRPCTNCPGDRGSRRGRR